MESLSEDVENPIVHDAYPKNIYETKKEKHKVSIGLSLKFAEIIEPKEALKLAPKICTLI